MADAQFLLQSLSLDAAPALSNFAYTVLALFSWERLSRAGKVGLCFSAFAELRRTMGLL